jgi:hypothetical protein
LLLPPCPSGSPDPSCLNYLARICGPMVRSIGQRAGRRPDPTQRRMVCNQCEAPDCFRKRNHHFFTSATCPEPRRHWENSVAGR